MHTDRRQVRPPGDRYEARQTHRKCLPFYLVYVVFEFGCKQQSPSEADLCKRLLALPGRRGEQLTESRRRVDSEASERTDWNTQRIELAERPP